jgi:hypothetical protein
MQQRYRKTWLSIKKYLDAARYKSSGKLKIPKAKKLASKKNTCIPLDHKICIMLSLTYKEKRHQVQAHYVPENIKIIPAQL